MQSNQYSEPWQEQLKREINDTPTVDLGQVVRTGIKGLQNVLRQPVIRYGLIYAVAFAGILLIGCAPALSRWVGTEHLGDNTTYLSATNYENGIFFWRALGSFFLACATFERIAACFNRSIINLANKTDEA